MPSHPGPHFDSVASARVRRTHLPHRSAAPGMSVREADRSLRLDGGGHGLLDTTHFDTVRFPPPPWIAEAMAEAIDHGDWAYTPYRGDPGVLDSLGEAISAFLGSPVTSDNLALTPGTQGALFTTLSAIVDEGDLVLLADPDYLFCERVLAFLGARIERIPVGFDGEHPTLTSPPSKRSSPNGRSCSSSRTRTIRPGRSSPRRRSRRSPSSPSAVTSGCSSTSSTAGSSTERRRSPICARSQAWPSAASRSSARRRRSR